VDSPQCPQVPPPSTESTPPTPTPSPDKEEKKKKPSPPATALPDPPEFVDAEAWAGFVAMRSRIRHPLTARAATLVHRELEKLRASGHDPNTILDNSTRNGWRDVFAPRTKDSHANSNSGRKLSVVERVEQSIRDRRSREPDQSDADFGGTF
jgi:hypothetical protein